MGVQCERSFCEQSIKKPPKGLSLDADMLCFGYAKSSPDEGSRHALPLTLARKSAGRSIARSVRHFREIRLTTLGERGECFGRFRTAQALPEEFAFL